MDDDTMDRATREAAVDRDMDRAVELAEKAYQAALKGPLDSAREYVFRVSEETGDAGLVRMLMHWADRYHEHATGGQPLSCGSAQLLFMDMKSGTLKDAGSSDLPAEFRWAGQLIAARAASDKDMFFALITALPADPWAMSAHIRATLSSVVATVATLPRGFSLMSRPTWTPQS